MALAVVDAVEWVIVANRREVSCAAHVDVLRLHEVQAAGVVARVDVGGQQGQRLRAADGVGMVGGAVAPVATSPEVGLRVAIGRAVERRAGRDAAARRRHRGLHRGRQARVVGAGEHGGAGRVVCRPVPCRRVGRQAGDGADFLEAIGGQTGSRRKVSVICIAVGTLPRREARYMR